MALHTRSTLRQIGLLHQGRARRRWLRGCAVLGILLAAMLLTLAARSRMFAPDGAGRIVYLAHDHIFLWLKGELWVQFFPYALIWAVPLAGLTLLGLVEFLTRAGPLRALQRRTILLLASRSPGQRLLARGLQGRVIDAGHWRDSLRVSPGPGRQPGFARQVLTGAQEALWLPLGTDIAQGRPLVPGKAQQLLDLTLMRLRLGPSDAGAHLRALEICAALPDLSADLRASLSAFYAAGQPRQIVEPLVEMLDLLDRTDPRYAADVIRAASLHLRGATGQEQDPSQATVTQACAALSVFVAGWAFRLPAARLYQRLWIEARLGAQDPVRAEVLARAESLIFFDMWSRLAEIAPAAPDKQSLLGRVVDSNAVALTEQAEAFAWNGGAG